MTDSCARGAGEKNALIFACSGACNVGQLADDVGLELAAERVDSMSCIAAIGAHLSGFVASARDCDALVMLDGCEHHGSLGTPRQVQIEPTVHLTLTEQGARRFAPHGLSP